jgi:hypothetical protein
MAFHSVGGCSRPAPQQVHDMDVAQANNIDWVQKLAGGRGQTSNKPKTP